MRKMVLVLAIALAGCASVSSSPIERILVESQPEGAEAVLFCHGRAVDYGVTPVQLRVRRQSSGCRVRIIKEGYEPAEVKVLSALSRQFWFDVPLALLLAFLPVEVEPPGAPGPVRIADRVQERDPPVVRVVLKPAQ